MTHRVLFADQARERLLVGIDKLARAVAPTLGPIGGNVAVDGRSMGATKRYGPPQIIAQGQRIIRDLELPNRFENVGVELLKQAAHQTDELVGDGTTTTIVLAHAMIKAGIRNIVAGANPMIVKRGMEKAVRIASQAIQGMASPLQTNEHIRQIMASASGSAEVAEALMWAVEEVGADGLMLVERYPKTLGIVVECVHGFQYDRGYMSHYFAVDSADESVALEEPYVLLTNESIERTEDIIPVLRMLRELPSQELLVIAPELHERVLGLLLTNNRKGTIHTVAVRPPSYGDTRHDMLYDLADFVGGRVLSRSSGIWLTNATADDLGRAESVVVTANNTTVVGGCGDTNTIQARIAGLRELAEETTDFYQRGQIDRRIAQLAAALARIKVGGGSEAEMDNLVELVECALTSMRATLAQGIVPGAGVALANAALALEDQDLQGDEATGVRVVREALDAPLRQIAANAGENSAVVLATVRRLQQERDDPMIGYDVISGEYGNLMEWGIVDPCRTVRVALANAASCAMMILSTDVVAMSRTLEPPNVPVPDRLKEG